MKRPKCICLAESSPRPWYSTLYKAVTLSTTINAKRESAIMDAAAIKSCAWWSVLCALAYATLSKTSCGINPYLHSIHWMHSRLLLTKEGLQTSISALDSFHSPLGNLHKPLRSEGTLGVDVHGFSLASSHLNRQLQQTHEFYPSLYPSSLFHLVPFTLCIPDR